VDVVYSRIQELGGRTGRNHATYLPPRPYMRPALNQLIGSGELTRVATDAFERAVS
jgi:phage gpG-like protein